MGYVWRDGSSNDHVCVTGERRTVVAQGKRRGTVPLSRLPAEEGWSRARSSKAG